MATPQYLVGSLDWWGNTQDPTNNEVPEVGEIKTNNFFANLSTGNIWRNTDATPNAMTWQKISPLVQADWNESNSNSDAFIKNKPLLSKIFLSSTFADITTARQLSTTQDAYVNYVFPVSMTSLLTSQSLTATLQYADNSGMSTNLIIVNVDIIGASGILNLSLSGCLQVSGIIPKSKYVRVVLAQSGGATVPTTISSSQEVLI